MATTNINMTKNPVTLATEGTYCDKDIKITCAKIRTIFRIGLQNDHDAVVLGAFGCGIFHNPPQSIASCFDQVLNEPEFQNKFKKVVFAILEDQCSGLSHNNNGNYQPFKDRFCK